MDVNPAGRFERMSWDKDGLRQEVESYDNGTFINWQELAKKYKICNTAGEIAMNGGQIAKEWLKAVDLLTYPDFKQDVTRMGLG